MNYNSSVSDFFKIPNWKTNLLLGAVAVLIPMVGPLVLAGWHVTCLWARGNSDDPARFPPFNFDFFLKYLERGLWPFLVSLVASLVLVPVIMCLVIPLMIFSGVFESSRNSDSGVMFAAFIVGIFVIEIGLILAYHVLVTPLMLRATITQDFKSAFDLAFMKAFVSRVWKELLAAMVFMFGLGLCTMIITIITCYVGLFFVMPLVIFSWHHLQKQLYQLYLVRGGEPVPLSPKLMDLPPALPLA